MNQEKRKLLKALSLTGATLTVLPKDWIKPVAKSAALQRQDIDRVDIEENQPGIFVQIVCFGQ